MPWNRAWRPGACAGKPPCRGPEVVAAAAAMGLHSQHIVVRTGGWEKARWGNWARAGLAKAAREPRLRPLLGDAREVSEPHVAAVEAMVASQGGKKGKKLRERGDRKRLDLSL